MKIMLLAGEVSGDLHASRLARELQSLNPDLKLAGTGGYYLQRSGVQLIGEDISLTNTIGLTEALPFVAQKYNFVKKKLIPFFMEWRPQAVVFIDNQGMNVPLAKTFRKLRPHTILIYYFPPLAWIWGRGTGKKVAELVDLILSPHPQDHEFYKSVGGNSVFVGHPFAQIYPSPPSEIEKAEMKKSIGFDPEKPAVAVLPGSRYQEVKTLTQPLIDAAQIISSEIPEVQYFLPVAHPSLEERIKKFLEKFKNSSIKVLPYREGILKAADVAMGTSGTTSLELAYLGIPQVATYRVSWLTYFIGRLIVNSNYITLPNIFLNEEIICELLQDINPGKIAGLMIRLLKNKDFYKQKKEKLLKVRVLLGEGKTIRKAAQEILEFIRRNL